jgi:uncharacterized circularly permuted ATP-grasp superfamily protein
MSTPNMRTARGPALSDAVRALDEKILRDPANDRERYEGMIEAQRRGGLMHGTRPLCPFLRPHIVSGSEYRAATRAAGVLAGAFERLATYALGDDALLDELGLTGREARMARLDPGYSTVCVTSRLDSYLTETGFAFLEYNAETPAGVGDQIVLERMLFELPLMREFLAEHRRVELSPHGRLLDLLLETYREWGGRARRPVVAIVDWEGVPTAPEFEILREYFEAEDVPTIVVDPGELEYSDGRLRARGRGVDVVYKRVIIHEFLERCDDAHPLARAYADGRVCLVNSFRSKVVHKKASFAVLSDPRFEPLFTPEEIDAARVHIPWTRRVRDAEVDYGGERVPMRELLVAEKDRLVLKPNDSYGGHDVTIGPDTDPERWAEMIELALAEPFVVQELVRARKVSIPRFVEGGGVAASEMTVDFNPYLFATEAEGGLVRLSSTSLSNVSSGGGETALLVVED